MAEDLRLVPRTAQPPQATPRDLLAVVFRQRRVLSSCFLAIFLGSLLYGYLFPSYESEMKILVRRDRVDPMLTPAPTPSPEFARDEISEQEMNSEAELLHDQDILRTVVQRADLLPDQNSWLYRIWGQSPQSQMDRAVKKLARRLNIEPAKKTTMIVVGYSASDPEQSQRVLSALSVAYLKRHEQVRRPPGEFQFFDQQVVLSRKNLDQAEHDLMQFTNDEGVVSAALERDDAIQKLSDAEGAELQTRVQLSETVQRIRSLEEKTKTLPSRTTTEIRNSDNPELLQKLKSKLLELELQHTDLLTKFQPTYRLVQEVEQQIAQTKSAIAAEDQLPLRDETTELDVNHEWAKSELVKAQVEFNALAARARATGTMIASYRQSAENLQDRAIKQEELLRDVKEAEEKYLLYVNKREEARIGDALDQGGILNVTVAEAPTLPVLPMHSETSMALIGLVLGGSLSTGLAFAADSLSPVFRTPDEVSLYLGSPVLASLPRSPM
jgi:polysaccharide biosynthesis transport protein